MLFRQFSFSDGQSCFLAIVAAIALPHVIQAAPWTLGRLVQGNAFSLSRFGTKLLALYSTFAALVVIYMMARGFAVQFVMPLEPLWRWLGPVVLIITPFYVWAADRVASEPEDNLHEAGLALRGKADVDVEKVKQHCLSWVVKGFFAPLMTGFALTDISWLLGFDFAGLMNDESALYEFMYRFLFLVDVMFAASGYLLTLKLFDTHIRSTEPTALGWMVCLACYAPFWQALWDNFLNYEDELYWGEWLQDMPVIWSLWAIVIIFCVGVYAWASVSFGPRFSNLTNRGIITNGPYRFIKHPAYVAKNISWWMVSIPFIANGSVGAAMLNTCAMAAVSGIYYMRAVTEERHLSRDPDYVAYREWISQHGLVARLKGLMGHH